MSWSSGRIIRRRRLGRWHAVRPARGRLRRPPVGVRLSGPDGPRIAARLQSVMAALATGRLRLRGQVVAPLEDAARVHRDLESGRLRAKVLLAVQS